MSSKFAPPLSPPSSRLDWSAIVAASAVSFALIVGVVAWIVTHPNKSPRSAKSPSIAALAPVVETTAEPPAPPAPPPAPIIVVPAFHRTKQTEVIVGNVPPIEDGPPPLPPPLPDRKHDAEPVAVKAADADPRGETYGTQVLFLNNPTAAAERAEDEHKLVFIMHISGNFEDACFT